MLAADFDLALVDFLKREICPRLGFGQQFTLGAIVADKLPALHDALRSAGIEDAKGKIDVKRIRPMIKGGFGFVEKFPVAGVGQFELEDAERFLDELEKDGGK